MKSTRKLLVFIFSLLLCSCSVDIDSEFEDGVNFTINNSSQNNQFNYPNYSTHTLIIQYKPGVSETEKMTIRNHYQVLNYEECHCTNKDIEKWYFDINIQIEPKKGTIEDDIEEEGNRIRSVDYDFDVSTTFGSSGGLVTGIPNYTSHIKTINTGVTIAVLDTGFDADFSIFKNDEGNAIEMLYNASETAVAGELSGWNFIDNNDNIYDDDSGKHGTAISYIFNNILSSYNIPHQIIVLKVFDNQGNANYFKMLCALQYAFERADIVNTSFGWYDDAPVEGKYSIFSNLLEDFNEVPIVTSAGNASNDNDSIIDHYPSSFDASNIIAIAAANASKTDIASFSNYGITSVDFFARGEGIQFFNKEGTSLVEDLKGTSFAAPQVGAMASKYLFYYGMTLSPTEILYALNTHGSFVSYTGKVKYDKFIDAPIE